MGLQIKLYYSALRIVSVFTMVQNRYFPVTGNFVYYQITLSQDLHSFFNLEYRLL